MVSEVPIHLLEVFRLKILIFALHISAYGPISTTANIYEQITKWAKTAVYRHWSKSKLNATSQKLMPALWSYKKPIMNSYFYHVLK